MVSWLIVGLSVIISLIRQEVTLPCSYQGTCHYIVHLSNKVKKRQKTEEVGYGDVSVRFRDDIGRGRLRVCPLAYPLES